MDTIPGRRNRAFTMFCHFRSFIFLAIGLSVFSTHNALGKELEDRDWIEVRTPNFRIRSVLKKNDTIELAQHLEMLRVAVSIMTNVNRLESPVPTEIFAVRNKGDFQRLGGRPDSVGIFQSRMRKNLIVIHDISGMDAASVIMHEYVHFLLRNHSRLHYPKWYDEGLAEYLGASKTRYGKFQIGGAPKGRVASLLNTPWIPMQEILSPEDYAEWDAERKSTFYAEAWALVHFLQHRPERETSRSQDMTRYIELIESGQGAVEAFEEAFGITVEDLDDQVQRHIGGRTIPVYRVSIDKHLEDIEPELISLSREQISLALGQVALAQGDLDSAKRWFTIARTDETLRPSAEAGLGDVFKFGDDFTAAQPHFEQAIALAPDDPYIQLDFAEYWHDRAAVPDDAGDRATYLARAREHYVEAWKLDDSMPETYAKYADTFMMEGRRYDFAVELLEQAENLLPSSFRVRMMLAEAYLGAGRTEDALAAARTILAWSHAKSSAAKRAREILDKLSSGEE